MNKIWFLRGQWQQWPAIDRFNSRHKKKKYFRVSAWRTSKLCFVVFFPLEFPSPAGYSVIAIRYEFKIFSFLFLSFLFIRFWAIVFAFYGVWGIVYRMPWRRRGDLTKKFFFLVLVLLLLLILLYYDLAFRKHRIDFVAIRDTLSAYGRSIKQIRTRSITPYWLPHTYSIWTLYVSMHETRTCI